jgi:putative phosphoribosyl transferase
MINYPDAVDPQSSQNGDESIKPAKPFPDLRSAGRELALQLEKYRRADEVVVLAIVLGGVPVAHEVAKYLCAPLDLVIIRRLLAPQGAGSQVCAVSVSGSMVIDKSLLPLPAVPATPLDHFVADAIAELNQRERICRRGLEPTDLRGRTVILVDCGIRTASTMQAAIGALRTKNPARIIAAVPVTSQGGCIRVTDLCDEFFYLTRPVPFGHVGLWYTDFSRPGDDGVGELL